uniref:Sialidase n=1 Tax=Trypanosoma cruzi TaxID=5693 RepID=TCNA_TRYCR|nr:RecName: Full=Sialidase; AltName: Full=Major surface antigen; AltName: Full=Neuraminidase; Short=NA [Trypanosoma cruzi]AAA30255.1 neuraminidase [Trypanosoma cruzi]
MVAIADARYETSSENSLIDTVAKYSVDDGETWETQIAIKNSRVSSVSRVVDPTVIVKGNKLYVLVGSYYSSRSYWSSHGDARDWDILLAVGEVTKSTAGGKITASIKWGSPVSLKKFFPAEMEGMHTNQFLGGAGVAIVASNGNLVYPVQVTNKRKQVFSKIFYSEDDGKTWKFGKGRSDFGCSEPVALEWEGKLIINTRVDWKRRLVYESSDMEKPWVEAVGTVSRVWGPSPKSNQPGSQTSFTAVTIEGMRVMLFTHPLNFKGRCVRDRLNLWLTDNQRIYNVGQVSIGDENSAYSSVLYKDDKLYCLHEINTDEVYSLVFARLVGELRIIKSVLRSWKNWTATCPAFAPLLIQPLRRQRVVVVPLSPRLVLLAFCRQRLPKRMGGSYRCVNASTANAERVRNGLKFAGVGGGALWPVSQQGQNQRYRFANHAFTLVASVTIHEAPRAASPLLGASLDSSGGKKLLGLSYDEKHQWQPIYGSTPVTPTGSWETGKRYHLVLTMANKIGSVYIDGELLEGSGQTVVPDGRTPDISHFYVGGYKRSDMPTISHVTVNNVLLYNRRQLNTEEIRTLFLSQDLIGTEAHMDSSSDSSAHSTPSTPADSSAHSTPSTPVDSSAHSTPSTPADSSAHGTPSTPVDSSAHGTPSTPADSSAHGTPSTPVDSSAHSTPSTPVDSSAHSTPSTPVDSSAHGAPSTPADSSAHGTPSTPVDSSAHGTPSTPADSSAHSTPSTPADSSAHSTPSTPADSSAHSTPSTPVDSSAHGTPSTPADSSAHSTPSTPADSSAHGTPSTPVDSSAHSTPSTPVDSSAHGTPSTPVDSSAHSTPSTPVDSSAHGTPSTPVDSSAHSTPSTPADSSAHSTPSTPADSSAHGTPSTPVDSSAHSTPSTPADSSAHSTPSTPVDSSAHSTPSTPADSSAHGTPSTPVDSSAHGTPSTPADSSAHSTPSTPADSSAHSTPSTPADSSAHSTPSTPVDSSAHSTPSTPADSSAHSTPSTPADSSAHSTPSTPADSSAHSTPSTPVDSSAHSTPSTPADSSAHGTPSTPADSSAHSTPSTPVDSSAHSTPSTPADSSAHGTPSTPADSSAHSTPSTPADSSAHGTPSTPADSSAHSTPSTPAGSSANGTVLILPDGAALSTFSGGGLLLCACALLLHVFFMAVF